MDSYDVFLSHNGRQKDWARAVTAQWKTLGLRVFFDEDDIRPGTAIDAAIDSAMKRSRFIVLVLTPSALASKWVSLEKSMAVHQDPDGAFGTLVPVELEPVEWKNVDYSISVRRVIRLTDKKRRTQEWHCLLRHLGATGELPAPPPWPVRKNRKVPQCVARLDGTALGEVTDSTEGETGQQDDRQVATAVALDTGTTDVEIRLPDDFDTFTPKRQDEIVRLIRSALSLGAVHVVTKRRGSVVLRLRMSKQDAAILISSFNVGALGFTGIEEVVAVRGPLASTENGFEAGEPLCQAGMDWFRLRVISNREKAIRNTLLRKLQIEKMDHLVGRILVPTEKTKTIKGGKQKIVETKMYPGYVFVEIQIEPDGRIPQDVFSLIKETAGVGDFVGTAGRPTPMKEHEIQKLHMDSRKPEDQTIIQLMFNKGENVTIKEGPFQGYEGTVDELLPEKGLVRVLVTIFGRQAPIEIEEWQLDKQGDD